MHAALRILSSFRTRGFAALWLSLGFNALSNTIAFVLFSWLALERTESALGVAVVMTALFIPRLFLAYPVGAHSDRADRRRLLQYTNVAGTAFALLAAPIIDQSWFDFWGLVALALLIGSVDTFQVTLANSYVFDLVGPAEAVNGMCLQQLAHRVFGVVGGFLGGWLLEEVSAEAVLLAMAGAYAISVGLLLGRAAPARFSGMPAPDELEPTFGPGMLAALKRLAGNRLLVLFAALGLAAEILAYSSDVLVPGFARDIFRVGETEYGTLISVRNAGGILALLLLGAASRSVNSERLSLASCALFALGLVWFALSPTLYVAFGAIFVVGVAYSAVDALLPVSVQHAVRDEDRGAASGLLICARGASPIGQFEIGLLAGVMGVAATQLVNGLLFFAVTLVAIVLFALARRKNELARAYGEAGPR